MFSAVIISAIAAVLSVAAIILGTYLFKLSKENKKTRIPLRGVFLALGFLPMALIMFSDIRHGGVPAMNYIQYFRTTFLVDISPEIFASFGELSVLIDFFSTLTVTALVVMSVSECALFFIEGAVSIGQDSCGKEGNETPEYMEERGGAHSYICFGRYLS